MIYARIGRQIILFDVCVAQICFGRWRFYPGFFVKVLLARAFCVDDYFERNTPFTFWAILRRAYS